MVPIHALPIELGDIFSVSEASSVEKTLSNITKKKHVYFTADARSAIFFILQNLNLKKKDEVLLPAYVCDILGKVVEKVCRPVYIDVKQDTCNIDETKITAAITNNTKAIIPVHLYGNPCDMKKVIEIANKNELTVVEDVAQALFAKTNNKFTGSFGDYSVFSFRFSKDISSFFGGAIATNEPLNLNQNKKSILKSLLSLGVPFANTLSRISPFYKMIVNNATIKESKFDLSSETLSSLQLNLLSKQIKKMPEVVAKRRANANLYSNYLKNLKLKLPVENKNSVHSFMRYTIQTNQRNKIKDNLTKKGIHADTMYDYSLGGDKFTNAVNLSKTALNLPVHHKMDKDKIKFIAEVVHNAF